MDYYRPVLSQYAQQQNTKLLKKVTDVLQK